ncbi:hypothetical protein LTR97_004432 [Elasticomyces elasticus]|uniref:CCZ1/INTU/HSP4 first Longin domain-containing protein n=1 Tax=Elasticomyces elasticus TaxID=574655 RepID=A0AAN7W6L6_9PEZI|nr:hypothetical protein LTR97_004432 [Elasticomyces elasticus]
MSAQWPPRVQPAQLAFLAIYNPTLGVTDETFADQCVYWYSRKATEARITAKQNARMEAAGGDAAREDENEKLRQIGLAQGMVDFAKSFSNGKSVDSIETERSRVVLHELEQGWWVLASVDLTRLPLISHEPSEAPKKGADKADAKPKYEYSSREVSPAVLLTQQLRQAHQIFLLHHGQSLDELWVRVRREKFCNALDRFWGRFTKHWDVLLHGNPAADVFGGLKLASGGELGFGVGEEEWGSGERDVLEDLTRRTEGMIDVVVSRFGEPAQAVASDETYMPEGETLPWMGSGSQPGASDGVVFGGVGAVTRPSLRNVSLWMRQIYTYGEYAYGIHDNPVRERRKRRRRNPPPVAEESEPAEDDAVVLDVDPTPRKLRHQPHKNAASEQDGQDGSLDGTPETGSPIKLPQDPRPQIHDRVASHDHALEDPAHTPPIPVSDKPGIPPSIIAATDRALEAATQKADEDLGHDGNIDADEGSSTWGVPDTYMKYLTFGLSELAKPSKPTKRPPMTKRTTTSSSTTIKALRSSPVKSKTSLSAAKARSAAVPMMTHLDPIPDGESLKARIAKQRRQENRGHFLVGLKGDLEELPEDVDVDMTDGSIHDDTNGPRTVLRTLHIEVAPDAEKIVDDGETLNEALRRTASSVGSSQNPAVRNVRRMRVLIYVHRPFMYCFLFENRTSTLAYSKFYKQLHRNLLPIHKPLLSSTNVEKVAQRIEASHVDSAETASVRSAGTTSTLPSKGSGGASETRPIFDLLWDPRLLTVHTSIPNIPEPGTPAAEGLSVGSRKEYGALPAGWTRLDALNVHSQVLSTLQGVQDKKHELERTSKTSRGWWVVWMRVPPSADPDRSDARSQPERPGTAAGASRNDGLSQGLQKKSTLGHSTLTGPSTRIPSIAQEAGPVDMDRMAFLVRKSSDAVAGPMAAKASASSRMASGMWSTLTLRPAWDPTAAEEEKSSSAASSWGPAALTGGMGVDARAYVSGLLSLNR